MLCRRGRRVTVAFFLTPLCRPHIPYRTTPATHSVVFFWASRVVPFSRRARRRGSRLIHHSPRRPLGVRRTQSRAWAWGCTGAARRRASARERTSSTPTRRGASGPARTGNGGDVGESRCVCRVVVSRSTQKNAITSPGRASAPQCPRPGESITCALVVSGSNVRYGPLKHSALLTEPCVQTNRLANDQSGLCGQGYDWGRFGSSLGSPVTCTPCSPTRGGPRRSGRRRGRTSP